MGKSKSKIPIQRPVVAYRNKSSFSVKSKKSIFQLSSDYSIFAVVMLLLTCIFWAYFSAKLQSSNADQLVNSYLFESMNAFHNATLPGAHSFLMKWPLFLLIKLLGSSIAVIIFITVAVTVLTVGVLAYVLYRIDRRPVVFGTLCLALSSTLLLVPSQPYAGGILPVNMALLATRNIEYILYIGSLVLLTRAPKLKSRSFGLGVLGLMVLGASDKLFLTLSIGGAGLALVVYVITQRWAITRLAARWLVASMAATLLATTLLWVINASGLTHITGPVGSNPYGTIHSLRNFGLGVVFGSLGILTNFGANPMFDAAILRHIPTIARPRLWGVGGMSFLTNIVIFLVGTLMSLRLYFSTLRHPKPGEPKTDTATKLAIMLFFSSLAAVGAFIFSDHYYVVDARYLTIVMFTVFISMAVYLRKKQLKSFRPTVVVGTLLTLSILLGMYTSYTIYLGEKRALGDINQRNLLVAQAIANHPVNTLVGDYWRTLPIKALQPGTHITPLDDCTHERSILSSKSWQPDLTSHSFAYLVSFDKSLTNYPVCSLDQIVAFYGRPNSSVLIAGRLEKPTEMILFYDQGIHKNSQANPLQTVLPVTPHQLPITNCSHTIMNIVAHQDDDLLFLSPDLEHDMVASHCIRTAYVTAGDGGNDSLYWLARERGSEAAYSKLIQSDAPWIERTLKVSDNEFVTVANPKGNSAVSLIFMRLADGSPMGGGFKASHQESLVRLEEAKVHTIHSVDDQSSYTSDELITVLTKLMQIYQPAEIHTQAPTNASLSFPDHSDHMAVGRFVTAAYKKYDETATLPLKYYIGYPIKKMPSNVNGADLDLKTAAFLAYSQFDPATCHSKSECEEAGNYGFYLQRQYTTPN